MRSAQAAPPAEERVAVVPACLTVKIVIHVKAPEGISGDDVE